MLHAAPLARFGSYAYIPLSLTKLSAPNTKPSNDGDMRVCWVVHEHEQKCM